MQLLSPCAAVSRFLALARSQPSRRRPRVTAATSTTNRQLETQLKDSSKSLCKNSGDSHGTKLSLDRWKAMVRVSVISRLQLNLDHRDTTSFSQSQRCLWRCADAYQTQHRPKPYSWTLVYTHRSSNQSTILCHDSETRWPTVRALRDRGSNL